MELEMAEYLKCFPAFDFLEWYEFQVKFDMLKAKVQKKKAGNLINLAEDFLKKQGMNSSGQ